jgi:hypothetical protein
MKVNPDHLAALISVETNKTFSPSIKAGDTVLSDGRVISTKGGGAVGLIQFTTYTAKLLGTTREELINMSAEEQLDYVQKYYQLAVNDTSRLKTVADMYIVVAFGRALNKNPEDVVFTKEERPRDYASNPAWDPDKDNKVKRKNITAPAENVYQYAVYKGKRISADDDAVI